MIEDSRERRLSKLSEFACDQCGYKTPLKTLLKRHIASVHESTCEQCDYRSSSKSVLKRHVESTHEFACNQCDFKLTSKALHVNNAITSHHQQHISRDIMKLLTRQNDSLVTSVKESSIKVKHMKNIRSQLIQKTWYKQLYPSNEY